MHGSHAGVTARVCRNAFEEGYRVRIAEPAAQIGLQTPPTRREISPYSTSVFSSDELAEVDDFPNSTPWIFANISP